MKGRVGAEDHEELAIKLNLPKGRLRLYLYGSRTIPLDEFERWCEKFSVNNRSYKTEKIDMHDVLKKYSLLGNSAAKKKYGDNWARMTGAQGMQILRKKMETDSELRNKWKKSVTISLEKKFGKNFYSEMGKIGGRRAIELADKEELQERYKRMFRNSFRKRIEFEGQKFRSEKEVELVKFLIKNKILYEYEKEILGFYPDFLLSNKTIVEVVGFDWRSHVEKTKRKIEILTSNNYRVIVYTYQNMVHHFATENYETITNLEDLNKLLGFSRG